MPIIDYPTETGNAMPRLHDGKDSIDTHDLDAVNEIIDKAQEAVGAAPGDRSDVGGTNFGSLAANFRGICRMLTGSITESVAYAGTVTLDGVTHFYRANTFWYYKKYYFLSDESESAFSEPPLFFATPTAFTLYSAGVDSGHYELLSAWRTTRAYIQVVGGGQNRHKWALTGTWGVDGFDDKQCAFDYILIQPMHGRNEISTELAE